MKNALTTQVGILGDMFLWLVANKGKAIYLVKQAVGMINRHVCIS